MKECFDLNLKGEQFLAVNDTFDYQHGYLHLRDYYVNSLAEGDTMYKGKRTATKENNAPPRGAVHS